MADVIKLITGLCGSGKTHRYLWYISKHCHEMRFIVAVPTIEMARELFHRMESTYQIQGLRKLLSTDGVLVSAELATCLHPNSNSRVLIITHKALENLGRQALIDDSIQRYLRDFTVILDESPSAVIFTKVAIEAEKNHPWLNYVSTQPQRGGGNGTLLIAGDIKALKSYYKEPQAGDAETRLSVWSLLAGFPLVKKPKNGKGYEVSGCVPNPILQVLKFCAEFYFVSANAENSSLVVVAREIFKISAQNAPQYLQPDQERNKHFDHVVTCYPLLEKRASLSRLSSNGLYKRVLDKVLEIVSDEFIYATNSDKLSGKCKYKFSSEANAFFSEKGKNAGYVSHGVNLYGGKESHGLEEEELLQRGVDNLELYKKGYANAVWLGVSRLSNEAKKQLNAIALYFDGDGNEIIEAVENFMSFEAAYQLVLRSRLRIPDNREPIKLVFIDAPTADYIVSNYIPNAKVIRDYVPEMLKKSEGRGQRAIELSREGKTANEIAAILGVGKSSVYVYLKGKV